MPHNFKVGDLVIWDFGARYGTEDIPEAERVFEVIPRDNNPPNHNLVPIYHPKMQGCDAREYISNPIHIGHWWHIEPHHLTLIEVEPIKFRKTTVKVSLQEEVFP